jgi:membrane protein YdbS with pleckstrin-like domain
MFCLFRVYRWMTTTQPKSDLSSINELYRGLNSEETKIQNKIVKHSRYISWLRQAQVLVYAVIAGEVLWFWKTPAMLSFGTTLYLAVGLPLAAIWLFGSLIEGRKLRIEVLKQQKADLKLRLKDTEKILTD